jgi:hypothetical protein
MGARNVAGPDDGLVTALTDHVALKLGESTADLMYLNQQAIDTTTPAGNH